MSTVPAPWLTVVGIGAGGLPALGEAARAAIADGELLVGGARHLAMVPNGEAERLVWVQPLEATLPALAARRGRRVVVLASGDPLCHGVGALLARTFGAEALRVLPAPSAFSLACARLAWPLEEVTALSLHGRPLARLRRHLLPGARLVLLSRDGTTPAAVAALAATAGYGPSRMWVFEHLDGPAERRLEGIAESWPEAALADLNTIALDCRAAPDARPQPLVPGLPDELFEQDGMLTKREVRAATLARLAPLPGQMLWDVGAGSGAIAIEWLRSAGCAEAIAVEREARRAARIRRNADALGAPELAIVAGEAPGCLAGLPPPDAVFIGGGLSDPELLPACWQALRPGGRLVANVVTLEGERMILDWQARHGGELVRLAIARLEPVGPYHGWRALMPVTQLAQVKP
jgi:precorrin-6Y C5,15-methyltransferase (decarboxylating)